MRWFSRNARPRKLLQAIPGAPALEFRNVSFERNGQPIIDNLTIALDEKRIGIIGDNGSGKSTLVRMLNGLIAPDDGELLVFGHCAKKQASELAALVGFLFQNPDHQILFPTVLEELAFGLMQLGLDQTEAEQLARNKLKAENCFSWSDRPSQSLSEGEKQRLCLWAVMLMNPKLLVLDESFSSLDLPTRGQLMRHLELQSQRQIMITHELELVRTFDRVLWLHKGRIVADGAADSVIGQYLQYVGLQI